MGNNEERRFGMNRHDVFDLLLALFFVAGYVFFFYVMSGCAARRVASERTEEREDVSVKAEEKEVCGDTVEYNDALAMGRWGMEDVDIVSERYDTMGRVMERTTVARRRRGGDSVAAKRERVERIKAETIRCYGEDREIVAKGDTEERRSGGGWCWWWLLLALLAALFGAWWFVRMVRSGRF